MRQRSGTKFCLRVVESSVWPMTTPCWTFPASLTVPALEISSEEGAYQIRFTGIPDCLLGNFQGRFLTLLPSSPLPLLASSISSRAVPSPDTVRRLRLWMVHGLYGQGQRRNISEGNNWDRCGQGRRRERPERPAATGDLHVQRPVLRKYRRDDHRGGRRGRSDYRRDSRCREDVGVY